MPYNMMGAQPFDLFFIFAQKVMPHNSRNGSFFGMQKVPEMGLLTSH